MRGGAPILSLSTTALNSPLIKLTEIDFVSKH